jgi:hypothetical protein
VCSWCGASTTSNTDIRCANSKEKDEGGREGLGLEESRGSRMKLKSPQKKVGREGEIERMSFMSCV